MCVRVWVCVCVCVCLSVMSSCSIAEIIYYEEEKFKKLKIVSSFTNSNEKITTLILSLIYLFLKTLDYAMAFALCLGTVLEGGRYTKE